MTDTHYQRGLKAEELACDYLSAHGYEVLARRYKTKYGEIDVIASQGNSLLCFVEVKFRPTLEEALEAVTPRSRRRIEQSALQFLSEHPDRVTYDMRFDVIAVTQDGITQDRIITHLDNAWEACA